jgi:hypothetical protein
MSNTPPRRGERRPAPGGAPRNAPPPGPSQTNRTASNRRPPADDSYDQYEPDDQVYRDPRTGKQARNTVPTRQPQGSNRPQSQSRPPQGSDRYQSQSRRPQGPQGPQRYSSQRPRYVEQRRDSFPIIMGALVGALVIGLLIVVYMLVSRNNGTVQPGTTAGNTPNSSAADQPTAAAMAQSTSVGVNVQGTQTMEANRPTGGLGTAVPDEGNQHVADDQTITYKNYPPTSGTHYSSPADAGFYATPIAEGHFVHSMEHGYVVLYYKPDLPAATIQELKDTYTKLPNGKYGKVKIVIGPYTNMTTPLAIAAWDRLLPMSDYNFDEIKAFYQQYVDKGPEDVP